MCPNTVPLLGVDRDEDGWLGPTTSGVEGLAAGSPATVFRAARHSDAVSAARRNFLQT